GFAPAGGKWKVYILDEAHMLTREAWNAFLKTLEEPPPNTVFVLATTEAHKVMPTIVDRCQRFDFQRPAPEQIAEVVRRVAAAESIEIAEGAIAALARGASGSFRDALGTLDQLLAYGGQRIETDDVLTVLGVAEAELLLAAADAIASGDGRATLEVSERLARSGRDVAQFGRDLLAHLRQLLVLRVAGDDGADRGLAAADPERMRAQAEAFSELGLGRAIDAVAAALSAIREGDEPRMTLELALLRAARPQLDPTREAFAQRLERLEQALAQGGSPPAPSTATQPEAASEPGSPGDAAPPPPPSRGTAAPAPPPRQQDAAAPAPQPTPAPQAERTSESAAPPAARPSPTPAPQPPQPTAQTAPEGPAAPASGGADATAGASAGSGAEVDAATAGASAGSGAEVDAAAGAAPATTATVAEAPDLERLRSLWPAVLERIREGSELLAHALEAARPIGVDPAAGVVEVG